MKLHLAPLDRLIAAKPGDKTAAQAALSRGEINAADAPIWLRLLLREMAHVQAENSELRRELGQLRTELEEQREDAAEVRAALRGVLEWGL